MNEKDKADVELMLSSYSLPVAFTNRRTADVNQRLRDAIVNLLTTARQEARQAAFKDAVKAIKRLPAQLIPGEVNYNEGELILHRADVVSALEATANSVQKDSEPELDLARVQMEAHNQHHE